MKKLILFLMYSTACHSRKYTEKCSLKHDCLGDIYTCTSSECLAIHISSSLLYSKLTRNKVDEKKKNNTANSLHHVFTESIA